MSQTIHEGRNIKRFREMLGIKQESLAGSMGADWTQKKISQLEDKITIEPAILSEVSAALKIPVEAFQNFDEEQAISVIANTFTDSFNNSAGAFAHNVECTFNPLDKVMELFERLLASEKEKVELMRGILDRMK